MNLFCLLLSLNIVQMVISIETHLFLFECKNEVEPFLPFICLNIVLYLILYHYLPNAMILILYYYSPYLNLQESDWDIHLQSDHILYI